MRAALSFLLVGLIGLGLVGCNKKSPTAPAGSTIIISASPNRIAADGQSEITVVALKADGFPVNQGTTVFFSSDRGEIPAQGATDREGRVVVVLRGNDQVGTATVRATAGAAPEATVEVQIGIFGASITLQSTPSTVGETNGTGETPIELLALVRDDLGQPLEGADVNFSAEVGVLDSGGSFVQTDVAGAARDTLSVSSGEIVVVSGDTFIVTVQVADGSGQLLSAENTVTIQRRPQAGFNFVVNNLTVSFEDTSTGLPTQWQWDFGDGQTQSIQHPVNTYKALGTYTVTLTATNSQGSDLTIQSIIVGTQ